eukprot:scaffold179822_cov31-Tisochrysis_lutea.AAC.6
MELTRWIAQAGRGSPSCQCRPLAFAMPSTAPCIYFSYKPRESSQRRRHCHVEDLATPCSPSLSFRMRPICKCPVSPRRYIASSVLGVTYLGINAILFWHNSHQSRSHFSFQLATAHTLWRLLIGITQVRSWPEPCGCFTYEPNA